MMRVMLYEAAQSMMRFEKMVMAQGLGMQIASAAG